MSDYRILAVYYPGIIPSLIEHTCIYTQNVGKIDWPVKCSLIRWYHNQMLLIDYHILFMVKQSIDEGSRRCIVIKAVKRYCICHSRVMSIEGNEIIHSHVVEFLKHEGTVKWLSGAPWCSSMLSSLIQERHNNIHSLSLTGSCCDHTFKVLIMIIRAHMIDTVIHSVGNGAVGYISNKKQIFTSNRVIKYSLCLTGSESRASGMPQIGIPLIALNRRVKGELAYLSLPWLNYIWVHSPCQILGRIHCYYLKRSNGKLISYFVKIIHPDSPQNSISVHRIMNANNYIILSNRRTQQP